ncbi:MAG: hypothetical protein ABL999_06820 [Pyrinomonadaceae bacterium]
MREAKGKHLMVWKRVLKAVALGLPIYLVYQFAAASLMMYYAGGDTSRIRTVPSFDIAGRLPTIIFRYLFPEQVSDFYKPGFSSQKLLLATASFLMNIAIFSFLPYLFFYLRDRSKTSNVLREETPPPPSFDA